MEVELLMIISTWLLGLEIIFVVTSFYNVVLEHHSFLLDMK